MLRPTLDGVEAKLAALDLYAREDANVAVLGHLLDLGIDLDHVTNLIGPVCHAPVTFFEGGLYDYDTLGTMAYLFVVFAEDAETEVDIVAWSAREPNLFGILLGKAALLGADQLFNPATFYGGKPCRLWRTPLRWLQECCDGAVVLQSVPASLVFAKVSGKVCAEDETHARELMGSGAVRRDKLVFPTRRRAA
jgi:hypothetical protein